MPGQISLIGLEYAVELVAPPETFGANSDFRETLLCYLFASGHIVDLLSSFDHKIAEDLCRHTLGCFASTQHSLGTGENSNCEVL